MDEAVGKESQAIFDRWLDERSKADRDPLTVEAAQSYRHIWTGWTKFIMTASAGQESAWRDATGEHLKSFLDSLKSVKAGRPVSPITRGRYWRLIDRVYQYACTHGHASKNPAQDIAAPERPAEVDPVGAMIPDDLWKAALANLPQGDDVFDVRDRAILMILFHTALAPQEIRELRMKDILRDDDLARSGARGPITALQIEGTGPCQSRRVYLSLPVAQALQEWLTERQFCTHAKGSEIVFCSRKSPAMSAHALLHLVTLTLGKACKAARLPPPPRMGPQSIRNTLIVRWLNSDVPLDEVVRRAGLKNVKGLLHLRDHANEEVRAQIAKKVRNDE